MPVYGNLGQLGKKGAYEILGAKVEKHEVTGLISVEMPEKKAKKVEAPDDAKAESETKEGKKQ